MFLLSALPKPDRPPSELLELNCPGSSYFRPRFVVSTSRLSCSEAFPGLFHHHSDHSGSSHVHRTALFSARAVLLGWKLLHPTEGVSNRPKYSSTYKNIPAVSWRSHQASPFFRCLLFYSHITWYSFFTAGQLLLPAFQSQFQFTVVSLTLNSKSFPALLFIPSFIATTPSTFSKCVNHSSPRWYWVSQLWQGQQSRVLRPMTNGQLARIRISCGILLA